MGARTAGEVGVVKQTAIAIDQVFNTVIWIPGDGFGTADETLSARAWRLREQSNAYKVIDAIFFWDRQGPKRHCQLSYEAEMLRLRLPLAYRK